ncbi:hypothetical protein Q427_06105 [Halomonas sp. BC04]|nr:hypothetical protein Q427_06105 [Halomonas sp. BC04]
MTWWWPVPDVAGHDDGAAGHDLPAFKLMLFVLVDGWQLIIGSLAESFYI